MSKQRVESGPIIKRGGPMSEPLGGSIPLPMNFDELSDLRDRLAMSALEGMMASESISQGLMKVVPEEHYKEENALEAYRWADAMLKAREV